MEIRLTTGMYEGGRYYDPGDIAEFPDEVALLYIERGHAEALPGAELEAMALAPAAENAALTHQPKHRRRLPKSPGSSQGK